MKTKYFDKGIYKEGLLQLKTPAFICFVITLAFELLSIISNLIIKGIEKESDFVAEVLTTSNAALVSYSNATMIVFVFTPIFAFLLFKFLFKRKECDFYHALWVKRETLYTSFGLSAFTVSAGLVVFDLVFVALARVILFNGFKLSSFLPNLLNLVVASALIISVIMLSCSISGRFFSALVTSVVILLYPRIFMSVIIWTIRLSVPSLDSTKFDYLLGNKFNVITGGLFNGYTFYGSVFYSLVLAGIYFAIGMYLFKHRKSEQAQTPGSLKTAQVIFRTAFCMIFCLPAIIIIYTITIESRKYELDEGSLLVATLGIIILYFFAILSYFLYEIFTKRKLSAKAILQFGWVLLINVVLIVSLFATEKIVTSYNPDAQKVDTITIYKASDGNDIFMDAVDSYIGDNAYETNGAYAEQQLIEKFVTGRKTSDKEAIKIACDAFKNYKDSKYSDPYDNAWHVGEGVTYITIGFTDGLKTTYRQFHILEDDLYAIINTLDLDDNAIANSMPKQEDIKSVMINPHYSHDITGSIAGKEALEVYKTAVQEIGNVPVAESVVRLFTDDYFCYFATVTDNQNRTYYLPIYEDKMPKTVEQLTQAKVNKATERDYRLLKEVFENYDDEDSYAYYDLTINSGEYYELDQANYDVFLDYLKTDGKVAGKGKRIFKIAFENDYEETGEIYFYAEESWLQKLCSEQYSIDSSYDY